MKPNIVVTIGDPAGVGPEVTLKALADQEIRELADWRIVGDASSTRRNYAFPGKPTRW